MQLGERLCRERRRRHLSQEALAEALGTSSQTISRWERSATFPQAHYRLQLSRFFGVSPEELFGTLEGQNSLFSEKSAQRIWHVPHLRNPYFTGREVVMDYLHELLQFGRTDACRLFAVTGMGGIGKTQTVIEYTYRYASEYEAVLWIKADSRQTFLSEIVSLAQVIKLPVEQGQNPFQVVEMVKQWLKEHARWLFVFDNVEDFDHIAEFLPTRGIGHLLFTSRRQATGRFALRVCLEDMESEEGALLLLRRGKILSLETSLSELPEPQRLTALKLCELMGGLPLALDQAGAFIEESGCDLQTYHDLYVQRTAALLQWRSHSPLDYPHAISTAIGFSVKRIEQSEPLAADLLRLCAFLHPDAIPEELLMTDAFPDFSLHPVLSDSLLLQQMLVVLLQHSLLKRHADAKTLLMHRLVQVVLKESLDQESLRQWAGWAVAVVNQSVPCVEEVITWQRCQRLLPQMMACVELIEEFNIVSEPAGRLLHETAAYLMEHAQYVQAQRCILRAVTVRRHLLGEEHPQTADSLNHLAELFYYQGDYQQAEDYHQQALKIRESVLGPDHHAVATSLNNLAGIYCMQRRYEQAEPLYERALGIRERVFGPQHLDVAESLQNLAYLYVHQARYTQAEPLYRRCLMLCQQHLGTDHAYLTTILNSLGNLLVKQGALHQAEVLYQQALDICQRCFPTQHPRVALTYANLAELSCLRGNLVQAEALYQQALAIQEQLLGTEHSRTSQSLYGLGNLYSMQGRYALAKEFYQRTLFIWERTLGAEHTDVVSLRTQMHVLCTTSLIDGKEDHSMPV